MDHPIVFIHGSGDSARAWRLQVEGLRDHHKVFAIDLPGHGQRADTLLTGNDGAGLCKGGA